MGIKKDNSEELKKLISQNKGNRKQLFVEMVNFFKTNFVKKTGEVAIPAE
jgi:hypothetical protein